MTKLEKITKLKEILKSKFWINIPKDKMIAYLTKDDLYLSKYLEEIEIVIVDKDKLPSKCEFVIGIKPEPLNYGNAETIEIDVNKMKKVIK